MVSKFLDETNKEFKEFMEISSDRPSQEVESKILNFVRNSLNPSPWVVFSKLSLIHFVVGLLTLGLCPQFDLRFFGEGLGVMKFFTPFGTYGCIALCGAFFIGTSLFASSFVLRIEELRVLRKHRLLQISLLVFLSLGAFVMADAEIILAFGIAWGVGSLIGGLGILELGWWMKRHQF